MENTPTIETTAPTTGKPKLTTPGAIIIAGLIISASIFITNGGVASGNGYRTIAQRAGLNATKMRSCLDAGTFKDKVEAAAKEGVALGVQGTPFSVLSTKSGVVAMVSGALPLDYWKTAIDTLPTTPAEKGFAYMFDNNTKKYTTKAFPAFRIPDANDHILGNLSADIIITEYSDTECPFCKAVHPTLHQVVKEYNGKVAWDYRHFPLDSIHPRARREAEAMECAAQQGGNDGFWKYADALFEATPSNNGLDPEML